MGEITLSTSEFKALSSESRTKILKLLEERNHTLTELSAKLEMASPTVKQHLTVLLESGLVELRDEGRKWKYYALTRKGKNITSPADQTHFLIVLSFASIALIAMLAIAFYPVIFPAAGAGDLRADADIVPASVVVENGVLAGQSQLEKDARLKLCEPECDQCDPFEEECGNECERCVKELP